MLISYFKGKMQTKNSLDKSLNLHFILQKRKENKYHRNITTLMHP